MILVSIDPGVNTGWARFVHGALSTCGLGVPPIGGPGFPSATDVVIEKPQIYVGRKQKVDPNDLITLAILVGKYAERAKDSRVELVLPSKWKGQVPKPKRGEPYIMEVRVMAVLTDEERERVERVARRPRAQGLNDNIVDAVGVGLWFLGRLG